jgi:hypothetical protein
MFALETLLQCASSFSAVQAMLVELDGDDTAEIVLSTGSFLLFTGGV